MLMDDAHNWVCGWLACRWGELPAMRPLPDRVLGQQIAAFCAENRLSGALYAILKKKSEFEETELLRWLGLGAELFGSTIRQQRSNVAKVLYAFNQHSIPVLVLKSWAFYPTIYQNDPASRPGIDLDLLIKPEQMLPACHVLEELGYTLESGEPRPGFLQRYAYTSVFSQKGWLPIGLHTGLLPIGRRQQNMLQLFFDRSQSVIFEDTTPMLVLSAEDNVLYLSGHLALHHQYHPGLFRDYDLALIIRANPNLQWEQILSDAQAWNLVLPLQKTLQRLERHWPGIVDEKVLEKTRELPISKQEKQLHYWAAEQPHNAFTAMLVSLLAQNNFWQRLSYLFEMLYPSHDYMYWRYGKENPDAKLLSLYWLRWSKALKQGILLTLQKRKEP